MDRRYYNHLWAVIHLSALNYDETFADKNQYTQFYNSLSCTLGCATCIDHYRKFITENPPDFEDIFGWTVKLHNSVNETIGGPIFTREECLKYWL